MTRITAASGAALVLLVSLASTRAEGQKPQPTPPPFGPKVARVDVTVTNLDVVVTDSKGNRVTGLKKSDFEVIEDGLKQSITNFYAVDGGRLVFVGDEPVAPPPTPVAGVAAEDAPPPIPTPKTRIVIFVDSLHLSPFSRNRILRNLRDFLKDAMRPDVEAMVVVYNRSLKIRKKFTSDARDLADVLRQIEEESALGLQAMSERRDLIRSIDDARSSGQAMALVRSYCQSLVNDLDFTIDAMRTTLNQLSGLDGRKIMIHVSDGLPQSPGAEMWQYVAERFSDQSLTSTNAFEFDKTAKYASVIQAANASGVTLYTIDASGLSTDAGVSAENATSKAKINSFIERTNNQGMLELLAAETGGLAILNRNDVLGPLKEVEKDYSSYYSLGYRSIRSGVDRPHRVEVKMTRKGLTVRARSSYLEKGFDTKIAESVTSALFFPRDENPLQAAIETGVPAPADRENFLVPLTIRVPFSRLTLLPDGPKARGRVILYFIVLDAQGKQSDLATQLAPIEVDAARLDALSRRDFVHSLRLLMIPGSQRLSLAIRDELSSTVSYLQKSVFVSVFSTEEKEAIQKKDGP